MSAQVWEAACKGGGDAKDTAGAGAAPKDK